MPQAQRNLRITVTATFSAMRIRRFISFKTVCYFFPISGHTSFVWNQAVQVKQYDRKTISARPLTYPLLFSIIAICDVLVRVPLRGKRGGQNHLLSCPFNPRRTSAKTGREKLTSISLSVFWWRGEKSWTLPQQQLLDDKSNLYQRQSQVHRPLFCGFLSLSKGRNTSKE